MKSRVTIHAIAFCMLVAVSAQGLVQTNSTKRRETAITGRLINESGQPIPNATINVRKVGALGSMSRSIGTDQDGRFRADDLTPGSYSVGAYVPGYVPATDSVDRQYYRPGETVTLRMIKGGVISGTVTNMDGEPLIAARVLAVRVRDGEGRPIRGASGSSSFRQTDDRGIYRLYGLQAGSYLVQVGGGGGSYFPSSALDGDAPTYHPSTTRDAAAEVTVRTGDEIGGIDIRYRGDRGHIVSGALSGSLGSDTAALGGPGVSVLLARTSGAIEANSYTPLRGGDRGFALYGVPDGEYDLIAQMGVGTETSAASAPRRVIVKGTDVTGLELGLVPLSTIAGRVVLEGLSESERKGDCKEKRGLAADDVVLIARRDEKVVEKEQSTSSILPPADGSPDGKGEFKIVSLTAGRYRIETVLPTEDWFVRSITAPGPAASRQQNDIMNSGLAMSSGQRAGDLTVTIAEGASGLRGKVVPASEGTSLPSRLRVHLVPAEADAMDAVLRYAEAAVDSGGAFSLTNLAPGRYLLLARVVSDEEFMQRDVRPVAWDATTRTKLRRDAEGASVTIELQRCQRVNDYALKYSPPSGGKKRASTSRP